MKDQDNTLQNLLADVDTAADNAITAKNSDDEEKNLPELILNIKDEGFSSHSVNVSQIYCPIPPSNEALLNWE
jgi:hypothetical protein